MIAEDTSTTSSSDGSGGLSAGAWAGIAVAITVATAAAAAACTLFVARRRRPARAAPALAKVSVGAGSEDEGCDDGGGNSSKPGGSSPALTTALSRVEVLRASQQSLGAASALRVRFGSLEGLELGALIGRGAFGRVYRGRMRGVAVAVKASGGAGGSLGAPPLACRLRSS